MVKQYDRSIDVAWSQDSHAFLLNDAEGSNVEEAYIYRIGEAMPLALDDAILSADPNAKAIPADHAYFHAYSWVAPHTVLAEYCGHTTDILPPLMFSFHYRVVLNDDDTQVLRVSEIYHNVHPPSFAANAECTR